MASKITAQRPAHRSKLQYWITLALTYLLLPIILMICGWDFGWWQAWVFTLLIFVAGIGSRMWGEYRHPGLLEERAQAVGA